MENCLQSSENANVGGIGTHGKGPTQGHLSNTEDISRKDSAQKTFDTDQILFEISKKVNSDRRAILQLFRNNDSSGRGAISREALRRVLRVLYGYVSELELVSLLRRLGINNRTQITYDVFMACFEDCETLQKRYLRKQLMEPFWQAVDPVTDDHCKLSSVVDPETETKKLSSLIGRFSEQHGQELLSTCNQFSLISKPVLGKLLKRIEAGVTDEDLRILWDKLDPLHSGLAPVYRLLAFMAPAKCTAIADPPAGQPSSEPKLTNNLSKSFAVSHRAGLKPYWKSRNSFAKSARLVKSRALLSRFADESMLEQLVAKIVEPRDKFISMCARFDFDHRGVIALSDFCHLLSTVLYRTRPISESAVFMLLERVGYWKCGIQRRSKTAEALRTTPQKNIICGSATRTLAAGCSINTAAVREVTTSVDVSQPILEIEFRHNLACLCFDADRNQLLQEVLQEPERCFRLCRGSWQVAADSTLSQDISVTAPSSSFESVKIGFMRLLYSDLIRLIAELRRIDRDNRGAIPLESFAIAFERVFAIKLSNRQIDELTRGAINESAEFLQITAFVNNMFNRIQPSKCKLLPVPSTSTLMGSSTANNNVSIKGDRLVGALPTPPAGLAIEKQTQLQATNAAKLMQNNLSAERSSLDSSTGSEQADGLLQQQHKTFGITTEMSRSDAQDLLRRIMKDRFHSFDKLFMALDNKQTKRISPLQLLHILRTLQIHINMKELAYMWADVPQDSDGLCSYRRFVQRYLSRSQPGSSQSRRHMSISEVDVAPENLLRTHKSNGLSSTNETIGRQQIVIPAPPNLVIGNGNIGLLDAVLEKMVKQVCGKFALIKQLFKHEDEEGCGSINAGKLDRVFQTADIVISCDDMTYLKDKFDIGQTNSRFCYLPFLRYFANRTIVDETGLKQRSKSYIDY